MEPSLQLEGLTKTYGSRPAVRELDLSIAPGAVCGLIGANGAGKTSTIRMIMSIVRPDSGVIRVLGHRSAMQARNRIGYLPEERGVYAKMLVEEYLVYIARLKGVGAGEAAQRARRQLERMELGSALYTRIEELSKGTVQKVQFLAAVLHEPDLLILDEPFSGLDPVSVRSLRELIIEHRSRGANILFSTHVMAYAEELCDSVVMISQGAKVLDSPMTALRQRFVPRRLLVEPLERQAALGSLRMLSEVEAVDSCGDGAYSVLLREGTVAHRALARLADQIPLVRAELQRPRLEDIFLSLSSATADISASRQPQAVEVLS